MVNVQNDEFPRGRSLHVFRGNMYVEIIYTQLIDFWSMKD